MMIFGRHKHCSEVASHYQKIWGVKGRDISFCGGPMHELPHGFSILEFEPRNERNMWTYATCGMSQPDDDFPMELHVFSPKKSGTPAEVLVATAHYHRTGHPLGIGHTVNLGTPWISNSSCTYGLISRPYLDGPELENLYIKKKMVNFLWLVPITADEVTYKISHGFDALEGKFEEARFNYLDPNRTSVC